MNLWDRLDRRFPHIKRTLISNEYADDGLLSSELLLITRLMWQRRIRSMTLDHGIVPILVFSLMGTQHVRILQAHSDGSTLIILKSKTLDLTTRDDEALDLLGGPSLDQSYIAPSLYHYHDRTQRSKVSPEVLQIRNWNRLDVHYGISN
ncbi:hypothetical protein BDV30DRAFT_59136 [Aspergillus minisclerotigenes]|uniref:Uncharacterized protein n=1 Tax=Aspergillus minisclerotigenes TaxID=656917 RepID=A0A5N6JCH7_9EURO|nr:hypothetical protein BDV30DRAFT_59136 [Aspergillus minisclerotigenes]